MDPITKIRKRFSVGRRSSVDPMKFPVDDSCLMTTEEKRPRSGIPRIVGPASKRRSSSSDRPCSVSKAALDGTIAAGSSAGLLFTPQILVTPRVSLSARKAIDCISQLSAKSHTARKDQRTALDKNAQLRLARHVATYLNKTGLVGDLLAGGQGRAPSGPIQSSDLKNLNKGAFITLFNLLYKKLGSRRKVEFTSSNYHDSIPMIAKKLGYPGVIYKSHLLTPNTPHSWPYVIAFLGWMVDLVVWQEPIEIALESFPDSQTMAVKEFYLKSYVAYINEETVEPLEEHVREFRSRIYATHNVQPDLIEELKVKRDKLKSVVDADQESLNELRQQTECVDAETKGLIAEIENLGMYNSNKSEETAAFKDQIREFEKRKEELVATLEQQMRDKESLKLICSNQRLSKPEWDQLVAENKSVREGNQMLVEMCDQTKKVVDSLDLKISAIRNKLHKVWFEIVEASMSVQTDSAQVTHLLKLIQNFSHLSPDARVRFEEILNALHQALAEITSKVTQDQAKAKDMQDKFHGLSLEIAGLRKKDVLLAKELESLRSEYQWAANKFKEEENELNGKIQRVLQQVKHVTESSLGDCNMELEKIKGRHQEKLEALEATKQDYESILSDMKDMAESYLKIGMEKMSAFHSEASRLSKDIAKFNVDEDRRYF